MKTLTVYLTKLLSYPQIPGWFKNTYTKQPRFFNYIIICGIGVIINQFMLHYLAKIMYLWIANSISIFIAFMWNYVNALGSFSKYWGMKE